MFKRKNQIKALIVSLVVLLSVTIVGTMMYIIDSTNDVTNTFIPAQVTSSVVEDISGNTKKNVSIMNTGNIDAYIRAAVVVTWQDEEGYLYHSKPVLGTDYKMDLKEDTAWELSSDGFYYFKEAVAPEDVTDILIEECYPVEGRTPEGYYLTVEILGSAIQAIPENVVVDNWDSGVSEVNDDAELVVKRAGN